MPQHSIPCPTGAGPRSHVPTPTDAGAKACPGSCAVSHNRPDAGSATQGGGPAGDLFDDRPPRPPATEEAGIRWLQLIRSYRVGPATFFRLMASHGSVEQALLALPEVAQAAGIRNYRPLDPLAAQREYIAGRKAGARLLFAGGPSYPPLLCQIPDAPPVLWARGRDDLATAPAVALVGARAASSLGLRMARALARDLGKAGFAVASGLARGIDTAAHDAALPSGTIAVLAGGIDVTYPSENAALMDRIADAGLLLSEQPIGTQPQARHFPRRNRIVSGLSRAVVVVEAAARSGSLITARNALDQGREVLAVPGHPFDARGAGCNMLIRDGATLVRGAADVIEAVGPADRPTRTPPPGPVPAPQATRAEGGAGQPPPDGKRTRHVSCPHPASGPPSAPSGAPVGRPSPDPTDVPETAAAASRGPQRAVRQALQSNAGSGIRDNATPDPALSLARRILEHLGASPVPEDQLVRDLALPTKRVLAGIVDLELSGQVRRHSGGRLSLG